MNVFITGATGFVGRALAARLDGPFSALHFGDADWRSQLAAADLRDATIFHLAARVHEASATQAQFVEDNVAKTQALADAAAAAGARRIVFLSTIKVNGEETASRPFTARDAPAPHGPYAESKWQAEQALRNVRGVESCVVRSPLVYGPGVGGNLRSLVRVADSPWPLPFGSLHNRRSFVHVDDLARLLTVCASHPAAPGATFLAAHEEPVSTAELISGIRQRLSRRRRLFSMPAGVLEAMAGAAGMGERMRRLTRSLELDPRAADEVLEWTAQIGLAGTLEDMVHAYLDAAR